MATLKLTKLTVIGIIKGLKEVLELKLMTSAQMREMDRRAIEEYGIPSTLLMRNAARATAETAMELGGDRGRAAVFCGSGNNGGDGVAAAAYMIIRGYSVRTFLTGSREKMTDDTSEMERRLCEVGGKLEKFTEIENITDYVNSCDVLIDAMFGTGLHSALRGEALIAAQIINASGVPVVSADIPSGVVSDTGEVPGEAVRADVTVTFSLPKIGLYAEPGCLYAGKIRIEDIGIPDDLILAADSTIRAVTADDVRLLARKRDAHKGDFGRDLIIAGAPGFTGAPVMAAAAASRMGAGLVHLGVPESIYGVTAARCTDVMPFPLPTDIDGLVSWDARGPIAEKLERCAACLAGPGLGRSYMLDSLIEKLVRETKVPLVLDADGINAVSGNTDILDEAGSTVILTPHAGEFARLGGDISRGRIAEAAGFAVSHSCVLVLKGHRTVSAFPDGSVYINTTGGPAMAKGGSGDVLAGMITALCGQGLPVKKAVTAAVYLHGLAGDICAEELGEYSVTPDDLLRAIPEAVKSVQE